MKKNTLIKRSLVAVAFLGSVGAAIAWQDPQQKEVKQKTISADTIPAKKVKDIDAALVELEKSRIELERTISEKDWEKEFQQAMKELDGAKIQANIEKALKEVDMVKIQAEIQQSLKEIDFTNLQKELQAALKEVDMEKMKVEIEKAMKEVDGAKIQAEIVASLAKVDMEKIKAEIQKVKETDWKEMQEELKNIQPQIEKSMASARESMEQAKKELTEYKNFIDGLDKAGLIRKDQPYTIEYKKGNLIINGKVQPDSVRNQFSQFLKDRKDFTIKKDADDFNIDND